MSLQQTPPLAGLLRVLFFLAVAVMGITTVAIGLTTVYEAPSGGEEAFEGFDGIVFGVDQETADYNRNLGLIFGFIGTGAIAVGLLGLRSRFNPLRAGLLSGGVGLVLAGVGFGAGGSDDWLTFVTSGLALLTLLGSAAWLDEGLPLQSLFSGGTSGGGSPDVSGPGGGEGPALG